MATWTGVGFGGKSGTIKKGTNVARIRNVKPDFFDDPDICDLTAEAALVFIGLWTQADRAGRLLDEPRRLKMRLRPTSQVQMETVLTELEQAGFIRRYLAAGIRLIEVINFTKHQRPHHQEPPSSLPEPDNFGESPKPFARSPDDFRTNPLETETETETEIETETETEIVATPSDDVLMFCITGQKTWPLTAAYFETLRKDYPTVDVLAELRKARAWTEANVQKRKTARGMPAFLVAWLNRAVEHVPATVTAFPTPVDWRIVCDQQHGGQEGSACGNRHFHEAKMKHEGARHG